MHDRLRRWLLAAAALGAVLCAALLAGVWTGRPLYYSDGTQSWLGADVPAATMRVFASPEPLLELPGPVRGRVAVLPDGRLLYGLERSAQDIDLVVFDPRRRDLPPEPLVALNSAAHDLAPAVAADGSVYFASDRPGGAGGFDLYVAHPTRNGYAPPEPVAAANSALDETDPAPSPDGSLLVFARVDRGVRGGDHGELWALRREEAADAAASPLFAREPERRQRAPIDRDPVFSADGAALWFVRQGPGGATTLLRCSRLQGAFDRPVAMSRSWAQQGLRSPLPAADGGALLALQPRTGPGSADLWLAAAAVELYPWWHGQQWLEVALLTGIGCCLLLCLLLLLGRRFRAVDLLTLCLLLSLLLHVLLLAWLYRVELLGRVLPGPAVDDGGFAVHLLAASELRDALPADGAAHRGDVAAEVRFRCEPLALLAERPGAALDGVPRQVPAIAIERSVPMMPEADTAERAPPGIALHDAVSRAPLYGGADPVATPVVELPPAVSPRVHPLVAARNDRAATLAVAVPAATLDAGTILPSPTPAPRSPAALPTPQPIAQASGGPLPVTLQDAPAVPPPVATPGSAPPAPTMATAAPPGSLPPVTISHEVVAQRSAAMEPVVVTAPVAALSAPHEAPARAPAAAAPEPLPAGPGPLAQPALPAPRVLLRDLGAAPTAAARVAGPERASPVASVLLPGPVEPTSAALDPVRTGARAGVAPPVAVAAPATALPERAGAGGGAPPSGNVLRPLEPRAAPVPAVVALRDRAIPEPPPRSPAGPGTSVGASSPAALAPVSAFAAPASQLVRPRTDGPRGVVPSEPVAVPGSLLEPAARGVLQPGASVAKAPALASPYSNRFGPKKAQALQQYGGTTATEAAVGKGLAYLARIQRDDGSWGDPRQFDSKYGFVNVGKSALCLLAFLGAGHTSGSNTEHSGTVQKAVAFLLQQQDPATGAFGQSSAYGHGITTYALAECFGLERDPALQRPLELALRWILDHQGPRPDRRNSGGFGYFSPGLRAEDDYARVSITAWMVMALESARLSGFPLPGDALPRVRRYLELSFDAEHGWFRYNHKPSRLQSAWPTLPASTPAGAFCLMLLGVPADDAKVVAAAQFTVDRRPVEYRRYDDDDFVLQGQGNVYFWYYGTLCCFLAGGEAWQQWNERLRTLLPAAQDVDGSFPPIDVYARYAGDDRRDRSYTTAMCVLSLEIYYRYFTPLLVGR